MKILKVKMARDRSGGRTHYTYPVQYDPQKITIIIYETTLSGKFDEVVARGDIYEFLIGFVKDIDATQFLASSDIEEITRNEANDFCGADIDKSVSKISDPDAILLILAKAARGESLTAADRKAIDPEDPASGITKSKSLRIRMDEYGL